VAQAGLVRRPALSRLLEAQVAPWLAALHAGAPGCHVIIVGTHADAVGGEELAWQAAEVLRLAEEHASFLHGAGPTEHPALHLVAGPPGEPPLVVSARTGAGVAALRALLVARAEALPFYGELLPPAWVAARDALAGIHARLRAQRGAPGWPAASPAAARGASPPRQAARKRATFAAALESPGGGSKPAARQRGEQAGQLRDGGGGAGGGTGGARGAGARGEEAERGYMWVGDFNKMLRALGVETCQLLPFTRYAHDAGWIRFFAFRHAGGAAPDTFGGFDDFEPYRATGSSLATNSSLALHSKRTRADDGAGCVAEHAWANLLDTVALDCEWLAALAFAAVRHNAARALREADADPRAAAEFEAHARFHRTGATGPGGAPPPLRLAWRELLPDPNALRRMRHVLEARGVFARDRAADTFSVPGLVRRPLPPPPQVSRPRRPL
jgi:hypothetical protein